MTFSSSASRAEALTETTAFNREDREENPQRTQSNPDNPLVFALRLSLRP
jgi:hypothetical protein